MTILRIFQGYVTAIVLLFTIVSAAQAKYSGGTGDPNDPYQIATAEDLMLLGETPEDYDKHFILTADIDLWPYLPGRKVFDKAVVAPGNFGADGFRGTPFTGVFDGNDHTITSMTIEGRSYLGLFGMLGSEAEIKSLGVIDVNIVGSSWDVGGLVGINDYGNVIDCYSTGEVSGSGEYVGGLVGENGGEIVNCYSTSKVSGISSVGGLVGANQVWHHTSPETRSMSTEPHGGLVTRCYSTGAVTGSSDYVGGLVGESCGWITNCYSTSLVTGGTYVGGLVGANCIWWNNMGNGATASGLVTQCYSNGAVTGSGEYVGGLVGDNSWGNIDNCYSTGVVNGTKSVGGLVGSPYYEPLSVVGCVWDTESSGLSKNGGGVGLTTAEMMDSHMLGLNGFANDPNWILDPGRDYPKLAWQGTPGSIIPELIVDWLEGSGTAEAPYRIDIAEQLIMLSKAPILWASHFVLGADIDLDPNLPGRSIFGQPLIQVFTGVFDGNSHKLSHLTIIGESYVGLFGEVDYRGHVKDLSVVDVNITGSGNFIGGLAGKSYGTLTRCYSTGSVRGDQHYVGGLVGDSEGTLTNCHSVGAVTGKDCVGGLVGDNRWGNIDNCYSTGEVSGHWNVGGLVGVNYSIITASNSSCTVHGRGCVGGLTGKNHEDIVMSYSTGMVSGHSYVGGLVVDNSYGRITTSYSTGEVAGDGGPGGLVRSNYQGSITVSFWDIETSGQLSSAGGTGLVTAEMQTASTFLEAGWDFMDEIKNGTEDIWWILEGQDYPRLWWEEIEQ